MFSLEQQHDRARVLKRATKVTERGPARRPDMTQDVIRPTWLAFLMGWGFILACSLVFIGWYDSWTIPRVWVVVAGLTLMLGSFNGVLVLRDSLRKYHDKQIVTREFELQVADSGRARILRTDPDNPSRSTVDRYQWQAGKLREFARANVDQTGAWTGPDRLIRRNIKDYVLDENSRFGDVVADFEAWGWITVDGQTKYWTERGKAEMARKAFG